MAARRRRARAGRARARGDGHHRPRGGVRDRPGAGAGADRQARARPGRGESLLVLLDENGRADGRRRRRRDGAGAIGTVLPPAARRSSTLATGRAERIPDLAGRAFHGFEPLRGRRAVRTGGSARLPRQGARGGRRLRPAGRPSRSRPRTSTCSAPSRQARRSRSPPRSRWRPSASAIRFARPRRSASAGPASCTTRRFRSWARSRWASRSAPGGAARGARGPSTGPLEQIDVAQRPPGPHHRAPARGARRARASCPPLEALLRSGLDHSGLDIDARIDLASEVESRSVEIESTLYRLVQEALTNVVEACGGRARHVEIVENDDTVSLNVTDDGRGFDPAAARTAASGSSACGSEWRWSAAG